MNTLSDAIPDAAPEAQAAAQPLAATRPFYWSVRRELWEHRSLYIAPLIAAGVMLFGFLVGARTALYGRMHLTTNLDAEGQRVALALPYHFVGFVIIITGLIVAVAYCVGALHTERRDRSILFWKSLPVSDLTTVLSKASIPLVATPVIAFAVTIALQLAMLLLNAIAFLLHGDSLERLSAIPLPEMTVVLAYGLVTLTLWYAPIYGWLLLVSAWARRAAFLWAVLPPLGVCVLEKFAFDTSNFASLLGDRLTGGFSAAFTGGLRGRAGIGLDQLDPGKFLTTPGLWGGLVFAAGFLAAAVWLRRRREPL